MSDDSTPTVRLNRFLAQSGVASRRGADTLIAEGRVRVDGVVAKPGTQVGPNAVVTVNGVAVEEERHVYLMMNKPEGFVTTLSDEKGRPTVMELVDVTERVVPVGRLDAATSGLLLLMNDGALANGLAHPTHGVPKTYRVVVRGLPGPTAVRRLERGVELDDGKTQPAVVKQVLDEWTFGRLVTGDLHARAMPLPPLLRPALTPVAPVATSRPGVLPNGYLSGVIADAACRAGGKRLCSIEEWTLACRGEDDQDFPYGNEHEQGACNVNRYAHPAATLHGNAALGHLDPRLNLVKDGDERMLRPTGSTPRCVSRWGKDGIYDMVGNLDEWLDDEAGSFAGGFYARSTRRGCSAVITVHPRRYFDYSLGTRCCLTP